MAQKAAPVANPYRDGTHRVFQQLHPSFRDVFLAFWHDLHVQTDAYNRLYGTSYNWRINNIKRPGSKGHHGDGRAADINLYNGSNAVTIKDGGFKPRNWQILDLLRATAEAHNREWGGFYKDYGWDPVHIDIDPYNGSRENWWASLRPIAAKPWIMIQ